MQACHCGPKFKHAYRMGGVKVSVPWPDDWPSIRDCDDWQDARVWICETCGKPAFSVPREADVKRGPADATHLYSAEGMRDGTSFLYWQTPRGKITTMEYRPYPRRPKMNDTTPREPLLFQLWALLDAKCDIIMTVDPLDNMIKASARERAQHEARGLSEAIAILMYPFMADADAVVRDAVARFNSRRAGTVHETPGLGEHMFDPHFNHDGTPRVQVAAPKARTPIKKVPAQPVKHLTDAEKDTIRQMLAGKMLSPEELSKMFSVPLATIVQLG